MWTGKLGASPFHIKGNSYKGYFKFIDKHHAGGTAAFLAAIASDELRAFAGQSFLPSQWYDIFPYVSICRHGARLTAMGYPEHLRCATQWQFRNDLHGIYRALVRVAGPKLVASRALQIASTYFDFGGAECLSVGERTFEVVRTGVPAHMVEWINHVSSSYLEEVVASAGGRDARAEATATLDDGDAHGMQLKSIRFRLTWNK